MSNRYIYSGMYDPKVRGFRPYSHQRNEVANEYSDEPRYNDHLDGHRNRGYMDEESRNQQRVRRLRSSGNWKYSEEKTNYGQSPWSHLSNYIYGPYGNKRNADGNPYEEDTISNISNQNNRNLYTGGKRNKSDAWIGPWAIVFGFISVFTLISIIVGVSLFLFVNSSDPAAALADPDSITPYSAVVTFNNVFDDLGDDATFTVFVSTSNDDAQLNESTTWASVQGLDPQPAYVAIYRCADFFGGSCEPNNRKKRQVTGSSVQVEIGSDTSCDPGAISVYCNGPLQPNTGYRCLLRAVDGDRVQDSAFSAPFTTASITTVATTETVTSTTTTPSPSTEPPLETSTEPLTTTTHSPTTQVVETTNLPTTQVAETTTDEPMLTTTALPAIVPQPNNISATSALLTFNNPFHNLPESATYSVFVGISGGNQELNESYTWAAVQGLDPQPPYVAIYRCFDFFTSGGSCRLSNRKKRQVTGNSVQFEIGGDKSCDALASGYCDGPLLPDTEYYCVLRAHNGEDFFDSERSETFTTGRLGTWAEWGSWGDCDVPCGGGIQRRERMCEDGVECIGLATQSQRCNRKICSRVVLYGSWEAWTSWTACSASCGGGRQVRTRECDTGTHSNLTCIGVEEQLQHCSAWRCPDCGFICPDGKNLSASCIHCECQGNSITGRVMSTQGLFLSSVKVYLAEFPYETITTTGPNGYFTLNNLCDDDQLVFDKSGYPSQTVEVRTIAGNVTLQGKDIRSKQCCIWIDNSTCERCERESLFMDINPSSKKRLVGDDVLLCCSASGNPMPEFYEWFKDGIQIANQTGSTLSISNLNSGDAGWYRCRANTASTALFSTEAIITVRVNADDYCPDTPESKFQQLPEGCTFNDSSVYDVGKCESLACRGESVSNETCGEVQTYCCAGLEYKKVNIQCEDFIYTLYKVMGCGCFPCVDPVVEIQGFVFAGDTGLPMQNISIYYNKTWTTNTSSNGQFFVRVPKGTQRVAIIAKAGNRTGEYGESTSVLTLAEDADGVYYITITLTKMTVLPPVDSTIDNTLTLSGDSGELLSVLLTANSVFDEDGNMYTDMVTPVISTIDPRNGMEATQTAPGDFTTTDDLGEEELLKTFGMITLSLTGAHGQPLQVPGPVEFEIPEEVLGTIDTEHNPLDTIKLYQMDQAAGRWDVLAEISDLASKRRRKRNTYVYPVTVPEITVTMVWYNFDAVTRTTCYAKVRAYENEEFNQEQQLYGFQVLAFVLGNDGTHSLSTIRPYGDNDNNGYCVVIRCDSPRNYGSNVGFRGYIVVKYKSKFLVPANYTGTATFDDLSYVAESDRLEADFDLTEQADGVNGPFHDWNSPKWKYSESCINSEFSDPHFQFHLQPQDQCYQHEELLLKIGLSSTCNKDYYRNWHSAVDQRNQQYSACFIKVKVPSYNTNIKVQAISSVGLIDESTNLESGQQYGYREDCNDNGFVCVEIKAPGFRGCSTLSDHDKEDLHTVVNIKVQTSGSIGAPLNVSEINGDFDFEYEVLRDDSLFTFEFHDRISDIGIFCTSDEDSGNLAVENAKNLCQDSDENIYAVSFSFGENLECAADIVFILDTSGSMGTYLSTNKAFMSAVAESLSVGINGILVSLVLVYNSYGMLWDLNSDKTANNEVALQSIASFPVDESSGGNFQLSAALDAARTTVLPGGRPTAPDIVVMFWDGDSNLASNAALLYPTARVLSVAPYSNSNVQSIVESDDDMFYLNSHSAEDFALRIAEIINC